MLFTLYQFKINYETILGRSVAYTNSFIGHKPNYKAALRICALYILTFVPISRVTSDLFAMRRFLITIVIFLKLLSLYPILSWNLYFPLVNIGARVRFTWLEMIDTAHD